MLPLPWKCENVLKNFTYRICKITMHNVYSSALTLNCFSWKNDQETLLQISAILRSVLLRMHLCLAGIITIFTFCYRSMNFRRYFHSLSPSVVCKQFGPDQARQNGWPDLNPNCLTLIVYLKEFFEKIDFEKNQQTTKKREKFPRGQRVKGCMLMNLITILLCIVLCQYFPVCRICCAAADRQKSR